MTYLSGLTIKQKISYLAYNLLWLILSPFLIIRIVLLIGLKKPGYTPARLTRFGLLNRSSREGEILIHCASVGEVTAIHTFVQQVLVNFPNVTITTNTTTGAERVDTLFKGNVKHQYVPYDFPLFHWLFLKKIRPTKVLINEMELWPNLCLMCQKMAIPLYLINGRMSAKSTATYRKFPALFGPMLSAFEHICAQGQRDYNNYRSLGIQLDKLTLTNNIKFEVNLGAKEKQQATTLSQDFALQARQILLAGSTHDPEEQVLVDAYLSLKSRIPNLLLIIVPRHPQRFDKVAQLLHERALNVCRMSLSKQTTADTDVLLCDQMGQLSALYALADVAFVGGSLAKRGGHNALEPAAFGVPIIMGPSTYNNPAICQLLIDANALKIVENSEQIVSTCQLWLSSPEERKRTGDTGSQVIELNKGALAKTLELVGLSS